ncbi:hypothetical protein [Acetobacter oeni]|uniref:Uncharacterized protein n=1 Tax=Acetobacter oeni TaxID=304077 RepID=A0A511XG45_9PROT|nr:hypothetical protein [Acetobacter oeni]GBR01436.1 hypothetical protein AA21952_0424 [Acetobacter oeni LMG 21952]GEN61905.1 hypothetical protein AOE01nite_01290 [Acetobacter oeni]
MTAMEKMTEQEQAELAARQRGRVLGLVGFTLGMVLVIYAVALIRI